MTKRISIAVFFITLFFSLLLSAGHGQTITRIAFGSCSISDSPQQMWGDILQQKPQLCIWLGDNIYGDTHDMNEMNANYYKQKSHPDYQKLITQCPIIGTWDDHDYGVNDGGKNFSKKKESKEAMLSFFDVPQQDEVRKHEGVYSAHTYGSGDKKVKVLLLDTRYFRDTLYLSKTPGIRYDPNPTGDVLGEEQWKWLEKELTNSDAALHIIGSSIQFIADDHGYEKWANFPTARNRFIQLLSKTKPKNTIIISGDRHMAEMSKMKIPGWKNELYDFTASGLTHTWSSEWEETNKHRVGELIIKKNFGLLDIMWSGNTPKLVATVRGLNGVLFTKYEVTFSKEK